MVVLKMPSFADEFNLIDKANNTRLQFSFLDSVHWREKRYL